MDVARPGSEHLGCLCTSQRSRSSPCHRWLCRSWVWTQAPQDVLVCGEPAGSQAVKNELGGCSLAQWLHCWSGPRSLWLDFFLFIWPGHCQLPTAFQEPHRAQDLSCWVTLTFLLLQALFAQQELQTHGLVFLLVASGLWGPPHPPWMSRRTVIDPATAEKGKDAFGGHQLHLRNCHYPLDSF